MTPQYTLWQMVAYMLRLGTLGFGGPVALVGYMQFVDRFDRPENWVTTLPAQYAALTPEAITKTADALLRPNAMTWVVVGDLSKIEAKVRALNFGTVEVWNAEGKKIRAD